MSEDAAEKIVRAHIDAYRRDDVEAALGHFDPHVVIDNTRVRTLDSTVAHGFEEVVREVRRWMGTFDEYEFVVERITDIGPGSVIVVVTERGRGKGSGVPVEQTVAALYNVLDGKIVRITAFLSEADARAAVGLSG